jgi:glycosyltransferase involved in cell wall biosynthesis
MKCLVAGTGRNISKTWSIASQSLQRIFDSLDNYQCVLVESNSSDNSLELLTYWASKDFEKRKVFSLGNLKEPSRTKRIAQCRNFYLDYFHQEKLFDQYDYLLVVDIDNILQIESKFKQQLESCFQTSLEWDAIASNRKIVYYDIWALRSSELGCTFDCWEMAAKYNTKYKFGIYQTGTQKYVTAFMKHIPKNSKWIKCQSAFGGMALYKTASIKTKKYNGDKTCEHIAFHEGLKMYINPEFISG